MTVQHFNALPADTQSLVKDSYRDCVIDQAHRGEEAISFIEFLSQVEFRNDTGLSYFRPELAKYNPHG